MKKTLSKLGIEGNFFNPTKGHYEKTIANIILNGERLRAFPLRSGTMDTFKWNANKYSNNPKGGRKGAKEEWKRDNRIIKWSA